MRVRSLIATTAKSQLGRSAEKLRARSHRDEPCPQTALIRNLARSRAGLFAHEYRSARATSATRVDAPRSTPRRLLRSVAMVLRNALARAAAPLRGAAQAQLSSAGVIGTLAPLARAGAPRHYRNPVENELYDRSRQEYSLGNRVPSVAADAWIAPNATLIGDTDVADQCSVWHGAVLKGDLGPVRLGAFSNVQERCVIDAAGCVEQIPRFSKTPTVSARARVPRKGSDGRREATRAPTRGDPRGSRHRRPEIHEIRRRIRSRSLSASETFREKTRFFSHRVSSRTALPQLRSNAHRP